MISEGREKIVSISQYRHETSGERYVYFGGLDTLRNPIIAIKGKPESMDELVKVLGDLLGVKVTAS